MKKTVKQKIKSFMKRSKYSTFITKELLRYGSRSQVNKALNELIKEEFLMKAGYGVYVTMERVNFRGREFLSPTANKSRIVLEALTKLDVETYMSDAQQEYYEGKTTQVPTKLKVITGKRRISRKIMNMSNYGTDYGKTKSVKRMAWEL